MLIEMKLSHKMIDFLEKDIYQDDVFYDKIENEFSKLVSVYNNQKINIKENKQVEFELLNQLKNKIEVVRGNVNNIIDEKKLNIIINMDKLANLSILQQIFKSKDLREELNLIKYRLENLEKIKESILRTELFIDKIKIINNSQLYVNQITDIKQYFKD